MARAKFHLESLQAELDEYISRDPYPVSRETDSKTGDYLFRVREVEKPPALLGLIASLASRPSTRLLAAS